MNMIAVSADWVIWALAFLLVAAAIDDAIRFRISNLLSLGVFLLGIAAILMSRMPYTLWQNAVIFVGLLVLGTMLFSTGKFGGGDVKLLAALGVWVNFRGGMPLLASIFIAGGILALLLIVARRAVPETVGARWPLMRKGMGIPYGVAIAIGGLFTIAAQRL